MKEKKVKVKFSNENQLGDNNPNVVVIFNNLQPLEIFHVKKLQKTYIRSCNDLNK